MEEKSKARVVVEVILTPFLLLALLAYMGWATLMGAARCARHALGFHGKHLERISSNPFHIDYRCRYCRRDVHVFRR